MTDKTYPLIEGNKLIAEFMGGIRKEPKNFPAYYQFFDSEGLITRQSPEERLKYHTSWDWLMPVVEKIKKWSIPDNLWKDYTLYHAKIKNSLSDADRNAVWQAVVQFIQWYNQQNIKI